MVRPTKTRGTRRPHARLFCAGLAASLGAILLGSALPMEIRAQSEPPPPNILFIIGDDHGWPYFGFMGDPLVQTPELDALASNGTTFAYGYSTSSVCSPSLQTLLTGLHPHQWILRKQQIEQEIGASIPRGLEVAYFTDTLPRRLSLLGYRSFQAGKHWEGTYDMAGFDAGTAQTFAVGALPTDGSNFGRPDPIDPLWDFVDTAGSEPLFLWIAPKLPHTPFDAPPGFEMLYQGLGLASTAALYYANITRLDALVGDILAGFSERNLLDNTLVIYLSDNGWEQEPYVEHWAGSIIGGSRGKSSNYEMGFRTPIIFNWPGRVPAASSFDDLVSFEDVFTTILDYAGSPPAGDARGFSLRARIEGTAMTPARDEIVGIMDMQRTREEEFVPGSGLAGMVTLERAAFVRTPEWRYLSYMDRGEVELYKIDEDPFEAFDLAMGSPVVTSELDGKLQNWLDNYLVVPEPSSGLLSASVVAAVAFLRRRSRGRPR